VVFLGVKEADTFSSQVKFAFNGVTCALLTFHRSRERAKGKKERKKKKRSEKKKRASQKRMPTEGIYNKTGCCFRIVVLGNSDKNC
jgi:hypothetical protein